MLPNRTCRLYDWYFGNGLERDALALCSEVGPQNSITVNTGNQTMNVYKNIPMLKRVKICYNKNIAAWSLISYTSMSNMKRKTADALSEC